MLHAYAMMPGSNQGQGPNDQGARNELTAIRCDGGSPMMNRMEGGGEPGVERNAGAAGNSPTGTAMRGNNTQAAVGDGTTAQAAPGLVGQAGSLVGSGHMLPSCNEYFWVIRTDAWWFDGSTKL